MEGLASQTYQTLHTHPGKYADKVSDPTAGKQSAHSTLALNRFWLTSKQRAIGASRRARVHTDEYTYIHAIYIYIIHICENMRCSCVFFRDVMYLYLYKHIHKSLYI